MGAPGPHGGAPYVTPILRAGTPQWSSEARRTYRAHIDAQRWRSTVRGIRYDFVTNLTSTIPTNTTDVGTSSSTKPVSEHLLSNTAEPLIYMYLKFK
jgi:hypothetical protein